MIGRPGAWAAGRAVRQAGAALALAAFTEAGLVVFALLDPPRIPGATEVLLLRGDVAWHGSERRSTLLRWINVETAGTLVSAGPATGTVPRWAEPAPPPDVRQVRHAALAAGWPLPAVAWTWRTDRGDVNFPPPVESETSGDAPKEGARRALSGLLGGRAPAGGHGATALLPGEAAVDVGLLWLAWGQLIGVGAAIRARLGRVTPRE